jgi:ABC-2 type transport system ATP-binding protein
VLEIEVDKTVDAVGILSASRYEAAVFGSLIHSTVDDSETAAREIRSLLEKAGIRVSKIAKIAPSLEDVFVALIETS